MPLIVDTPSAAPSLAFDEAVRRLEETGFDPSSEDSFAQATDILTGLHANREFLGDMLLGELKERAISRAVANRYDGQVLTLASNGQAHFLIRAAIWPADGDNFARFSGIAPYYADVTHDHNFDFLTLGYFGSGYRSEHYECDALRLEGRPGEPAGLIAKGTDRLGFGDIHYYRAHRDVHRQLPGDDLSISLNIIHLTDGQSLRPQYEYDRSSDTVVRTLNRNPLEALLCIAPLVCPGNGDDLVDHFRKNHPSAAIRRHAAEIAAAPLQSGP